MRLERPVRTKGKPAGAPVEEKSLTPAKKKLLIERVIQEIEHLPTLPHVVMRVLSMAESPKISALELSKTMDQSLAAKVLKMANSAYYGGGRDRNINSILHAIVMVGFEAVKEIILTTSLFHTFHDARDVQALQPLWQHSMECALISKRLAWIYRYDSLDEAYLAGLTHDIGRLVIEQYFSDQYWEIEEKRKAGKDLLEAEKEVMEITHAEIGGKISERWGFPANLVDSIAHHHDRGWTVNPVLGKILYFADQFISGQLIFSSMLEAFSQEGMNYPATWDSSDLESVEQILQEEIGRAKAMFNLATEKSPKSDSSPPA
jgi:putative nucleotidyltransferase with HDIG domain